MIPWKSVIAISARAFPRRDGIDIVTGRAQFLNDLNFSGLLHAKVLRSPHAHARIKRIDTRKAKSLEGVHAVVTWETIDGWRAGIPGIFRALDRTLRYVGDAVALVAAESEAIAEEATRRIEVTYEKFPAVLDDMEALKPGAPQLYEEFPGNRLPLDFPEFGPHSLKGIFMGNVDNGFAQADVVAEGNFAYDNIPNALPMESPRGCGVLAKSRYRDGVGIQSNRMAEQKKSFPDLRGKGGGSG